jgi:hypothetical protein
MKRTVSGRLSVPMDRLPLDVGTAPSPMTMPPSASAPSNISMSPKRRRVQNASRVTDATISAPSTPASDTFLDSASSVGSSEEWAYEEICKTFQPSRTFSDTVEVPSDIHVIPSSGTGISTNSLAAGITSLTLRSVDNVGDQALCAITPVLYVARSLSDLPAPSVGWTNASWSKWHVQEFSYIILVQREPLSRPFPLVQRSVRLGVEQLALTLSTRTLVSMHEDNLLRGGLRVYLTNNQLDVALEFLTEAFFANKDDDARQMHRWRWGSMRPHALVLAQEGLEREAMAVITAFLASAGDETAGDLQWEILGRPDVLSDWKGLLPHAELARMEGVASTWRSDRLHYEAMFPGDLKDADNPLSACAEACSIFLPPPLASIEAVSPRTSVSATFE